MYDYTLDDGGASRIGEDEEEEEKKKTKVCIPFGRFLLNHLRRNYTIQSCIIIELLFISCIWWCCIDCFLFRRRSDKNTLWMFSVLFLSVLGAMGWLDGWHARIRGGSQHEVL